MSTPAAAENLFIASKIAGNFGTAPAYIFRMRHVLGVAFLLAAGTGCKSLQSLDPPPPPPFKIAVVVEGDPGNPIAGACIQQSSKVLATTGPDGRAELTFRGADGDLVDTNVRCPEGYTSPQKPLSVRITR